VNLFTFVCKSYLFGIMQPLIKQSSLNRIQESIVQGTQSDFTVVLEVTLLTSTHEMKMI